MREEFGAKKIKGLLFVRNSAPRQSRGYVFWQFQWCINFRWRIMAFYSCSKLQHLLRHIHATNPLSLLFSRTLSCSVSPWSSGWLSRAWQRLCHFGHYILSWTYCILDQLMLVVILSSNNQLPKRILSCAAWGLKRARMDVYRQTGRKRTDGTDVTDVDGRDGIGRDGTDMDQRGRT